MNNMKQGVQAVESSAEYGIYVWILPNGEPFKDDEGNTLNIPSMRHDIKNMSLLAKSASYWGKPDGVAKFMPGVGRVTDSEAAEDIERMANGLTPYGDSDNWKEIFANERKSGR